VVGSAVKWIVIAVLAVGLLVLSLNTTDTEERYHQPTPLPCIYNPNTGDPITTPCTR
jgi:hypothetical protein